MRARDLFWALAGIALLGLASPVLLPHPCAAQRHAAHAAPADTVAASMRGAAEAFVATLGPEGRAKALMPFESEERYNWHFTPRPRKGLPLKEMTLDQRRAAHTLLQRALSSQGYLKATQVMFLENVLRELENDPVRRDPELYYVSIFGDPSGEAPWGWRLEGHHLSLNYSSAGDDLAAAPAFFGANPAEVRTGTAAGLRVLAAEEDLGRALMDALTPQQRRKAIILEEAPDEIVTGVAREAHLDRYEGLPASEMTAAQREMLRDILHEYAHNMPQDVAHEQLDKVERAGLDNLYFAWAGSLDRGAPHYYRIHGPNLILEYDNTQNDANHIHTIWRDLEDDFGEDLLRRHYEQASPGHGH